MDKDKIRKLQEQIELDGVLTALRDDRDSQKELLAVMDQLEVISESNPEGIVFLDFSAITAEYTYVALWLLFSKLTEGGQNEI